MKNYRTVFTGRLSDVQRIFNKLVKQNVCAIIRIKSTFDHMSHPGNLNESVQDILVHQDEVKRTTKLIDSLIGKNASKLAKMNFKSKPTRRRYV